MENKLLEESIQQFMTLPGIGRKTAQRFVLHLLRKSLEDVTNFTSTIQRMKEDVKFCKICNNISENDICEICANPNRDHSTICVVENINDVMAIEATAQYNGTYHVLGGVISPMDGISPSDLHIADLVERASSGEISEIILALPTTMEGETTNYYINKKLQTSGVKVTVIAKGIAVGEELQYTDEITLTQAIKNRKPFE
ncbi:MAG: recombination protein RecR [Bacteroidales bacterium]|jgi:recombination protein RecR|nr:recombination protein RecR [Bacteroidales bacterium]MBQ4476696.1 recombination protein RecR [Bacteroidales bacterium]